MDTSIESGLEPRLSEAFTTLTGEEGERYPPFRWQQRLLRRLMDADLPKAVDVPTGLGKTAVMALWLIALAEGSCLPRRLVYVVDRRAVVDQATRFAERLRRNVTPELAAQLHLDNPVHGLPISTLRGGFADNRDWLEDPSKPAIVVGTIDMVGSRLLFEGYGVSRRMRPYHAGLLGVDSLVVLDEAHLCPPFEALLRRIVEQWNGLFGPQGPAQPVTPAFQLMSLSATGRDDVDMRSEGIFRLQAEDLGEAEVRRRLTARKRLTVTELADPKSLVAQMAARAIELGKGASPSRVLAYCDSRRDAVDVKNLIDKALKPQRSPKSATTHASELLVGERRVHERRELEGWLECHGFLGSAKAPPECPTFLVATSAGEVGVDLDADHMVCDLVAYERMVQRLGRVNRRGGEHRVAIVDVFAVRPQVKDKKDKKGQGALASFETQLAPLSLLVRGEDERHDASPSATVAVKSAHPETVAAATTAAPLHPELNRPLLDAWAMTSLLRHEGRPEVAPWLRGWEEHDDPQTEVVWRQHLPYRREDGGGTISPDEIAAFFRIAAIHATEKLEGRTDHVFDWLLKRAASIGKRHDVPLDDGDIMAILLDRDGELVEGAEMAHLKHLAAPAKSSAAARVRNRRKDEWKRRLSGCVLVVDARIGGCRDGMLDEESDLEVATADGDEPWRSQTEDHPAGIRPAIRFQVRQVSAGEADEGLNLPEETVDSGWRHVRTFETRVDEGGMARTGLAVYKWHDAAEEEESRSVLSGPQLLQDHGKQVASRVAEIADRLGLPPHEVDALASAARLHDDGKAAVRWQRAMNAPDDGRVYAKTAGGGNPRLLEGYRHEFGSLLKAETVDLPESTRDLILHLIAAHHGYARPLIGCEGCEDGPPSYLEGKAGDAARRFVRLQKAYGPWGLAWREAILRAADQAASREWSNSQRRRDDG